MISKTDELNNQRVEFRLVSLTLTGQNGDKPNKIRGSQTKLSHQKEQTEWIQLELNICMEMGKSIWMKLNGKKIYPTNSVKYLEIYVTPHLFGHKI